MDSYWFDEDMKNFLLDWGKEKNEARKKYFKETGNKFMIEYNINGMPIIYKNNGRL